MNDTLPTFDYELSPLILLLADHPDDLAISGGERDRLGLHHLLHHRLAH